MKEMDDKSQRQHRKKKSNDDTSAIDDADNEFSEEETLSNGNAKKLKLDVNPEVPREIFEGILLLHSIYIVYSFSLKSFKHKLSIFRAKRT